MTPLGDPLPSLLYLHRLYLFTELQCYSLTDPHESRRYFPLSSDYLFLCIRPSLFPFFSSLFVFPFLMLLLLCGNETKQTSFPVDDLTRLLVFSQR